MSFYLDSYQRINLAHIYLFKVNKRNLALIIKTPEQPQRRCFFWCFLLLTVNIFPTC